VLKKWLILQHLHAESHFLCELRAACLEDTTVQYLCSTGSTVWLSNVGCDGEVRQATWWVRSVVTSKHSASSLHRPNHQSGSSHPFRSGSCHPDVTARCLRFFGHFVRSDSGEDHKRALNAGIHNARRRTGDDIAVVLDKRGCVQ